MMKKKNNILIGLVITLGIVVLGMSNIIFAIAVVTIVSGMYLLFRIKLLSQNMKIALLIFSVMSFSLLFFHVKDIICPSHENISVKDKAEIYYAKNALKQVYKNMQFYSDKNINFELKDILSGANTGSISLSNEILKKGKLNNFESNSVIMISGFGTDKGMFDAKFLSLMSADGRLVIFKRSQGVSDLMKN